MPLLKVSIMSRATKFFLFSNGPEQLWTYPEQVTTIARNILCWLSDNIIV